MVPWGESPKPTLEIGVEARGSRPSRGVTRWSRLLKLPGLGYLLTVSAARHK